MPYVPTVWVSGVTALDAAPLNNLEIQYAQAIADQQHEIFIPAFYGNSLAANGPDISAGGNTASLRILIPQDFTAIVALNLILLPSQTKANMHASIVTAYGSYAGGEAYNVHTETEANRNMGATTAARYLAHDISDLVNVAAIAAGDLLLVKITYSATADASDFSVSGIRLKYS